MLYSIIYIHDYIYIKSETITLPWRSCDKLDPYTLQLSFFSQFSISEHSPRFFFPFIILKFLFVLYINQRSSSLSFLLYLPTSILREGKASHG